MSSPAWSAPRAYFSSHRDGSELLTSFTTGKRRPVTHGFWASAISAKMAQFVAPSEFQALHGAPAASYMPFYLEGNNFFEMPVCKIQLTMRAFERSWSNPLWLRQETLDPLRLKAAPFEAPLGLWLPQCGETFRPLCSLPPKVQHVILRDQPINMFLPEGSHCVLALDYMRVLTELGGLTNGHKGGQFAPPLKPSSMARPRYSWQQATAQFTEAFDRAWAIVEPAVNRQVSLSLGSRSSSRDVPPRHPRQKMWVSMRCAASIHAEAYRSYYALPFDAITVTTPHHGGLFFNAAQLFPNQLLSEKTLDVMERIAEVERKRGNPNFPDSLPATTTASAQEIQEIPSTLLEMEASMDSLSPQHARRSLLNGVEHAVDYDAMFSALGPSSLTDVPQGVSDNIDATINLDAMMLFADDDAVHMDGTTEEDMNAADVGENPMSSERCVSDDIEVDLTAELDNIHNRSLTAADEMVYDQGYDDDAFDAPRVIVDAAAALDGDGPHNVVSAEMELINDAIEAHDCPLKGNVDIDYVAAQDMRINDDIMPTAEDDVDAGPTPPRRFSSPSVPTTVTLGVATLPVMDAIYHADPASVLDARNTNFLDFVFDDAMTSRPTSPFKSGGIA